MLAVSEPVKCRLQVAQHRAKRVRVARSAQGGVDTQRPSSDRIQVRVSPYGCVRAGALPAPLARQLCDRTAADHAGTGATSGAVRSAT